MQLQLNEAFTGSEHEAFCLQGGRHAVLLVHGFPGTPAEMRPLAETLHQTFDLTAQGLLLPGFGAKIDTLADYGCDDWLQSVAQLLAQLKRDYDRVYLIGLSLGGALSLRAAAQYPPDALILLAPFWRVEHILWRILPVLRFAIPQFKPFQLFKPDFDDPSTREGIHNFMPQANLDDPEVQQAILNFGIPTRVINEIRKAGIQGYEAAPDVNAPTLIVQGTQDDLVQPALTQRLLQRLSGTVQYSEVDSAHDLLNPANSAEQDVQKAVTRFIHEFERGTR